MLRLMGTKGINKLLTKTIAKPSISSLKMIHKQLLVASINQLPQVYFENGYYHKLLPEVAMSQRTMLENVLNLKGWKEKYYLTNQLDQLKPPVHFIWGDEDAFENYKTGIKKAEKVNEHTFDIVENAGHCPWLDQPKRCALMMIEKI